METVGVTVPVSVPAAELVKQLRDGKAVFSTNFGQYPRREAKPFEAPIIMRTDPIEDVEAMVSKLQREHPEACKAIAAPINNIYDYFDHYDVQLHGTAIIHAVLSAIAVQNSSTAMRVQEFTEDWKNRNFERFNEITADSQDLFTVEEKEKYDEGFLKDAVMHLQKLRLGIPAMVSDAANGSATLPFVSPSTADRLLARTFSTTGLSTLAEIPNQHLLGPPMSGYTTMVSMQQVPSVPLSAPPTNPIHPAHPVIQRQNSAIMETSGAMIRPSSLSEYHSDTEIENVTSSYVPVNRYGEDQNPRYHSHPTVLMEHEHLRISRDIKDLHPPKNIPAGIRDAPQSSYRAVQENISFDTVQYRQPRKPSLKNGSYQQIFPSGYPQDIGPIQQRSQVGFNAPIVHQFPAAVGPFPYQAIEPLQSVPQFMGSQISKQSGGHIFPHAPVRQSSHRPPPGQQYHHQGQEGLVSFPGGAITGGVVPGSTPRPGPFQLIIPKTRGAQAHEVKQPRISSQESFRGLSVQGLPFLGPIPALDGNQHRGQIRGWPENTVQSQGVPHLRIAPQNGYYGPPFPESQPVQNQSRMRDQPTMVRYRHPRLSFSNDARVLEHHDAQHQNNLSDKPEGTLRYEESVQSSRGGLRRNSRGRGSRRSSFAQHAPPHRVLNYHTREGFSDSDFVRRGNSAEHFGGSINTNHDKNGPYGRYSNSYVVPTETANYRAGRVDKENVAIAGHEVQRLQDTKAMAPEYISHDAGRFANYHVSHAPYRGQQTQPEWAQGGRDEYDRRIGPQRLYVGGQGIDQVDLHKLFAAYGHILEIIGPIRPKNSAERIPPFRFSFVTFQSPDDAERAQLSLDNTPIDHSGLYWTVRYAYDRGEKTDSGSYPQQRPYLYSSSPSAEQKVYFKTGAGTREQGHHTPAKNETQTNTPLTPKSKGKNNTKADEQPAGSQSSSKTAKKAKSQKRKNSQLSTPTRKEKTSTSERGVSQSPTDEGGTEEVRSKGSQASSSMTQGNKTKEEEIGQEKHATHRAQSIQQPAEDKVDHVEARHKEHVTPKAQYRKQQIKTSKEEKTGQEEQVTPKAKPLKHQTGRRGSGKKIEQILTEASPFTDTGLGDASALSSSPENLVKVVSDASHHQQLVSKGSPTKKPKKQGTVPKPRQSRTEVAIPVVPEVKENPEGTTMMHNRSLSLVDTNPDAWPALLKSPVAPSSLVAGPSQYVSISQSYRTSPTVETPKKNHTEKSFEISQSTESNTDDKVMARIQEKPGVAQSPSALLPKIETQDDSDRGNEKMVDMSKISQISSPNTAELELLSPATLVATSVSSVSPTNDQVDWAEEGEKQEDEVQPRTTALDEPKEAAVYAPKENVLVSYGMADHVDGSDSKESEVYTQTLSLSSTPEPRQSEESYQGLLSRPSYFAMAKAEVPRHALPADAVISKQVSLSTMAIKEEVLGEGAAKSIKKEKDELSEPAKSTFEDAFESMGCSRTNRKPLTIEPTPWIPPSSSTVAHTGLESDIPVSGKPKLRQDAIIKSSTLSIPSPPISTHMKKQKARTPIKEKFAKEPKVVKDTHVKASNIETSVSLDSKQDNDETKASPKEPSAIVPVSTKDGEVAARSNSETLPVDGPKDPSVHDPDLVSSSADEIRTYPSIDKANAVEDLFVPAPRQHRFQIISISLPTQSIQEMINPEIRPAPLQITAPESPASTTTTTKKNNKKAKKRSKSRQISPSETPTTPPPVKMLEAFRPLTPPEDVPVPNSDDDESFPQLESSTKERPSTPSLKALVNEQEASRPPTPPKELATLSSDIGEQFLTSELSTEASTLNGSPEGSHEGSLQGSSKGSPKGKSKVAQNENVPGDVPKPFSEMVAEYYEDKAEHYAPEVDEKLESMKAAGASPLLTSSDILKHAHSTFELPGPALAPTGYPPPTPCFELSESSMEQHHATLGMSLRSNQHPAHKRHESENMSEYSTTSSVKQRKLFSEVVTSPGKSVESSEKGQKTSNIVDLTGDDENESEGEMGPPKVTVKGKGKGKARGKGKGKKGNGNMENHDDAWKVPAGEKMWGSGEEK